MADIARELRFDPDTGRTVKNPPGSGYGYWVGGRVTYDHETGQFVLFYRERKPLEEGRAGLCGLAVSSDGIEFSDVWTATKEQFAANSIEEGHAIWWRDEWLLYVSYEIAGSSTWRIDLLTAPDLASFETQSRRTALSPTDFGLKWIKDPFVMERGGSLWMYVAAPARIANSPRSQVLDARPMDSTVLAVSDDGRYYPTLEYVFEAPGDDTWHGRRARINSVLEWEGQLVAMYDGGRTFYDNYEEKAGIAVSDDGRSFTRLASGSPWLDEAKGNVRYVSAVRRGSEIFFYYEYTRPDGSHELRVSVISP